MATNANSEPCQTSEMEPFPQVVIGYEFKILANV